MNGTDASQGASTVHALQGFCLCGPCPRSARRASASTVDLDLGVDASCAYVAALGETNSVTISESGGTYTVNDSAGVTAGAGCTQVSATQVTCPAAGVLRVTAEGRDLNDIITVSAAPRLGAVLHGGSGNDRLTGGPGPTAFTAAEGADRLMGGDGDDLLDGGLDNDILDGQRGSDTVSYSNRTAPCGSTCRSRSAA